MLDGLGSVCWGGRVCAVHANGLSAGLRWTGRYTSPEESTTSKLSEVVCGRLVWFLAQRKTPNHISVGGRFGLMPAGRPRTYWESSASYWLRAREICSW